MLMRLPQKRLSHPPMTGCPVIITGHNSIPGPGIVTITDTPPCSAAFLCAGGPVSPAATIKPINFYSPPNIIWIALSGNCWELESNKVSFQRFLGKMSLTGLCCVEVYHVSDWRKSEMKWGSQHHIKFTLLKWWRKLTLLTVWSITRAKSPPLNWVCWQFLCSMSQSPLRWDGVKTTDSGRW